MYLKHLEMFWHIVSALLMLAIITKIAHAHFIKDGKYVITEIRKKS